MEGKYSSLLNKTPVSDSPTLRSPHSERIVRTSRGGVVSARVLFDGTNGIAVNSRTRIRDQERAQIAADLKRSMWEKASSGLRTFALTGDVSEAHRQVPIARRDWHLLVCRVVDGGTVCVNTVWTSDVASASCYWSRVASSTGRLTQYLTGNRAESWHMLVADDFVLESAGESYRSALLVFFVLCAVSGVPLAWSKTAGGDIGSASSFFTVLSRSGSQLDARSGSPGGLGTRLQPTTYTLVSSKKV